MKGCNTAAAEQNQQDESGEIRSEPQAGNEDAGDRWRQHREHARVKAVGEAAIRRLQHRRREDQQAAEESWLGQGEMAIVRQTATERAERGRVEVAAEMAIGTRT